MKKAICWFRVFWTRDGLGPDGGRVSRRPGTVGPGLFADGSIASTYPGLPFGERLTKIYAESGKVHAQYFDFSLPKENIREDTPLWLGPAVFRAMRNEKLLDVVESIIGPEFTDPVQHVRIKPPEHLTPKTRRRAGFSWGPRPGTRTMAWSCRKRMRPRC